MTIGLACALPCQAVSEPLDACALVMPAPAKGRTTPPLEPPGVATVSRVTGANSVLLEDGREIRIASVTTPRREMSDPPSRPDTTEDIVDKDVDSWNSDSVSDAAVPVATDYPAAARSALDAWLVGQKITLYPVVRQPDRYGRLRARMVRISDGLWIEAELALLGLARVEPQSDDFGCARYLEGLESQARRAKRGIWADPAFAVIAADDRTMVSKIGRYVLIEGKVISRGTAGNRHYLNFGRNFRRDFAIVLVDKSAANTRVKTTPPSRFEAEGFDGPNVVGRRIRVRGVLILGGGGLVAPSVPEEIEWVQDQP